jgi:hypothetical protein
VVDVQEVQTEGVQAQAPADLETQEVEVEDK